MARKKIHTFRIPIITGDETLSMSKVCRYWEDHLLKNHIYVNSSVVNKAVRPDVTFKAYKLLLQSENGGDKPVTGQTARREKLTLRTLCGFWYLLLRIAYQPAFVYWLDGYVKAHDKNCANSTGWKLTPLCYTVNGLNHDGYMALKHFSLKNNSLKNNGYEKLFDELNKKTKVVDKARKAAELEVEVLRIQNRLLRLSMVLPKIIAKSDPMAAGKGQAMLASIDKVVSAVQCSTFNNIKIESDIGGQMLSVSAGLVTELKLDADPVQVSRYLRNYWFDPDIKQGFLEMKKEEKDVWRSVHP